MAGLLDFANTDEGMQGLGLLAAAAPQMAPMNFAGRLAQAAQGYQGMKGEQMKLQAMQNAQSLFPLQQQEMQLKLIQAQRMNDIVSNVLSRRNDQQQGVPAQGSDSSGAMPSLGSSGASGGGNSAGIPTNDGTNYSLGDLADLAAVGYGPAAEMLKVKQAAMQGVGFDPGKTYNIGGKIFTMPTIGAGMRLNANGQVEPIPGYAGTNAAIDAAKTGAAKAAEIDNSILTVPDGNGGTNQMLGNQYKAQMSPSNMTAAPGGMQIAPAAQSTMNGQQLALLQQERSTETDPMRAAALDREIGRAKMTVGSQSMPQSGQLGYTPSAAQLEANKARAVGTVTQDQKPQLDYSTNAATAFQKMGDNITGRLSESQALLQRITQSRDALTRFKAGGGTDTRSNLAQIAQGIGLPTAYVDKIAGGDLSAVQEFQKFAAQEALQTMQQSLATDTGPASKGNRMAMELFIKNNPNITTDPRAVEKIFNFQTQLHNDALAQSDAYVKYAKDPAQSKDPSMFGNYWAHQNITSGRVVPQMQTGQAMGTSPIRTFNIKTGKFE